MEAKASRNVSKSVTPTKSKQLHVKICGLLLAFTVAIPLPKAASSGTCHYLAYPLTANRGFHCDNHILITFEGITQQHCKLFCFEKDSCAGLSYNLANKTCVINSKACVVASAHPDFEILLFRPIHQQRCIRWVDTEPARLVSAGYQTVARATYNNQLLPGKHQTPDVTYVAWESGEHPVHGWSIWKLMNIAVLSGYLTQPEIP